MIEEALKKVIQAWEALPEGRYPHNRIQQWLKESMKPAIDEARKALETKP